MNVSESQPNVDSLSLRLFPTESKLDQVYN